MTRLYGERDLPPDAWDAPDPLADMTRQRDEAVALLLDASARFAEAIAQRDEWKARRDRAVEECRMLHQEGMSRRDHHVKHCGAAQAAAEAERQRDEAVKAFRRERARVGRLSDDALLTDMVEQAAAAVWQQLEAEHFGAWSIQLPQTRHHVKESMLPTVVAVRDALVAALADRPTDAQEAPGQGEGGQETGEGL